MDETIVAISTPPGEGAIGIIRISGHNAISIGNTIFRPKRQEKLSIEDDKKLIYGHILSNEHVLDEVMLVAMFAPKTYTREDLVEIHCHGGIVPMTAIMKCILDKGARMAEPGEFTKRAFLNGRLDLAQAESVMDMISAKTPKGFDVAFSQLEGRLSQKIEMIRQQILQILAHLAVSIDYPEEDIEEITYEEILKRFDDVQKLINYLLENSNTGRILREGLSTVIVGKPNVGKSSLLNALLKEARAIVTEIPGTTRDIIEEMIQIKGIPLKLVDTAGIRETEDVVEKIGVERSKLFFNKADLVIYMLSASEKLTEEDDEIIEYIADRQAIIVVNKSDLEQQLDFDALEKRLPGKLIIKTSVLMDSGIEEVETAIHDLIMGGVIQSSENMYVSNIRHTNALNKAQLAMKDAAQAAEDRMPYDFIEVDVKNAFEYLGEISGETIEEDLVNQIFKSFCLGK